MRSLLALLSLLAACGGPSKGTAPAAPSPRLVVLVVLDQFPDWAFSAKRPALQGHAFARLEHHVGRYPHGSTLTAPGHALLVTGQPPALSGIIANEWWDRDLGRVVKSVEDGDGLSAHYLRVPTLADAVALAGRGGKVVGVSLKDRAAILTGGAGIAVWFDTGTGAFTSQSPRAWMPAPVPETRLREVWRPLDAARLAALSGVADAQPGERGEKGFGTTFPHDPSATPDVADAAYATPLGNELVLETAVAAIAGEQLGADPVPDLLVVSLSAYDYVGHGWGHESWESWDMTLRLDVALDRFLVQLPPDTRVLVTSDHGASPLPETLGGGRLAYEDLEDLANRVAATVLGEGSWIAVPKAPFVYLTPAALAKPAALRERALVAVLEALRAVPGIERVERSADFAGGCAARPEPARSICWMIDPARVGELLFLPARGWIMEEVHERLATAHGSLHDYDREVPVLVWPRGEVLATGKIPMTEIAGILARWLGVTPPAQIVTRAAR